MEYVFLQMPVGREVNGRERNVAEQASASTLVQADETKLAHDVHRTLGDGTLCLGRLALNLKPDFASEDCQFAELKRSIVNYLTQSQVGS